jgi:hypothetical protein
MEKKCPEHLGTGITPKDSECHSHESDTQQKLHNLHCRVIGCPHALSGGEKYEEVPTVAPRNTVERALKLLDKNK